MLPLQKKEPKDCILDAGMHVMSYIETHFDSKPLTMQDELRAHRYLGCASLSIVHIAQGLSDLYLSAHVKCWDYAAAAIILEEVQGAYSIQNSFFTITSTIRHLRKPPFSDYNDRGTLSANGDKRMRRIV